MRPLPLPSQGAQVRRQTTGSSPLQRLPGKLLISPGSSRIHLITVTGSKDGPPPPPISPACKTLPPAQAGGIPGCQQLFQPTRVLMNECASTGVEPDVRNKTNSEVVQWRRQGTAALLESGPNLKKLVSYLLCFASICQECQGLTSQFSCCCNTDLHTAQHLGPPKTPTKPCQAFCCTEQHPTSFEETG